MTKVGHWVSPEKAVWSLGCVSQKNCLNEVKTLGSASTEPVIFCCGKTAAAAQCRVAAVFCCGRQGNQQVKGDKTCTDGHSKKLQQPWYRAAAAVFPQQKTTGSVLADPSVFTSFKQFF